MTFLDEVRSGMADTPLSNKPVGHVDSWSAYAKSFNFAVIDAVDFLGTHPYPYYEKDKGNAFSNVTTVFDYTYNEMLAPAGNKPVWVTECGWLVEGPIFGQAKASVDEADWGEINYSLFSRTNI